MKQSITHKKRVLCRNSYYLRRSYRWTMQFEWALLAEREHSVISLEKTTRTQAKVEKESQTYDTISLEWFMNEKSTQAINTIIRRMGVNEEKRENHLADDHSISMARDWIYRRSKRLRKQQSKDGKQEF